MFRPDPSLRTVIKGLVILGAIGALAMEAGCGWTARDEYRRSQRVTLSASPGDGSMGTFASEPTMPDPVNTSVASVPDEP